MYLQILIIWINPLYDKFMQSIQEDIININNEKNLIIYWLLCVSILETGLW